MFNHITPCQRLITSSLTLSTQEYSTCQTAILLSHPRSFPRTDSKRHTRRYLITLGPYMEARLLPVHVAHRSRKNYTFSVRAQWQFRFCALYRRIDWVLYLKGLSLVWTLFYSNKLLVLLEFYLMRLYCIMHLPFVAFIELAEFTCNRIVQMHKLFLLQAFLSPSSAGVLCKCKNYCFDYSTDRVLSFNSKLIPVVEEIGGRKECTNFGTRNIVH